MRLHGHFLLKLRAKILGFRFKELYPFRITTIQGRGLWMKGLESRAEAELSSLGFRCSSLPRFCWCEENSRLSLWWLCLWRTFLGRKQEACKTQRQHPCRILRARIRFMGHSLGISGFGIETFLGVRGLEVQSLGASSVDQAR